MKSSHDTSLRPPREPRRPWPVWALGVALALCTPALDAAPPGEGLAPRGDRGYLLGFAADGERSAALRFAEASIRSIPSLLPVVGADREIGEEWLGRVDELEQALGWAVSSVFGGTASPTPLLRNAAAPLPYASAKMRAAGVRRLWIRGVDATDGPRTIDWPVLTPSASHEGPRSAPAKLVLRRAPVFEQPRATIPPLAEASYVADRSTHLWVVGVFDRCDEREACLRWAQVVLRDGDDFRGGYVPAQHLAALDEWSGDPEALSVAVRPALLDAEVARYVVVARDRGGPPQAYEIEAPIAAGEGGAWPEIQATVTGERVRVQAGATRITLDLSSDDELTPRSKRGR